MFVFSSHTRPAHSETSTAALTTPALDRRSLRRFGISAPTATPQDLPPSLAQHGSCRRSSTSSSLPFRTHMGAENSAVVVGLPRWGPMLSPRIPNLVPIPGPRMESETPGQRPRSNYGHPQDTAQHEQRSTPFSNVQCRSGSARLWSPWNSGKVPLLGLAPRLLCACGRQVVATPIATSRTADIQMTRTYQASRAPKSHVAL